MHRRRRRVGSSGSTLFALVAAAAFLAACASSSSSSQTCSPGDTMACTCGSTPGLQTCNANGSAYGACNCTADAGGDAEVDAGPAKFMQPCVPSMMLADGGAGSGGMGNCDPSASPALICFIFPNRGNYCTHTCTVATDCAAPSPGCNGMGVCKAP